MDEPSEPPHDGDDSSSPTYPDLPTVITIAPKGDVLLEVTFETSKSTLRATRKALPKPRPGQRDPPPPQPVLKPQIHLAYRVDLDTLKKHSKYFTNLLGDTRFQEARAIESRLRDLSLRGERPSDLDPEHLPRVSITDDDEATRSAGREDVFRDMLRVLHGGGIATRPVTILYVATLAVMADRFACTATVSRYLSAGLRFKWPAAPLPRPSGEVDGMAGLSPAAEEVLRQRILVSWLLDQPVRFQAATKELVLFGSHRWSAEGAEENDDEEGGDVAENESTSPADAATASRQEALWWYLPDELEEELHYRRTLILRTLASILSHFLRLYSSRSRQCKLGYDSSSACDSYQLGEMVKFLTSKNLLFLVNFAPSPRQDGGGWVKDFAAVDVNSIIATLKQAPGYQIDKHHTHCGLRTRILPILEYVRAMLGSNAVPLSLQGWKKDRKATTWQRSSGGDGAHKGKKDFDTGKAGKDDGRVFRFTRSVATDQRLRYEGAMAADSIARQFFLAEEWDWTPEEDSGPGASLGREFATTKWLR